MTRNLVMIMIKNKGVLPGVGRKSNPAKDMHGSILTNEPVTDSGDKYGYC